MNSFGRNFRVALLGESHGSCVGVVIDGCPPGMPLCENDLEDDLARRRAGLAGSTERREADVPAIKSGVYKGCATGAPILVLFGNSDMRSQDYADFSAIPRPGHADFTSKIKFGGFADPRGSGHFSGRVTAGLVVAGSIAKRILKGTSFETTLLEAGGSTDIQGAIEAAKADGDSVGALVGIKVSGVSAGLGEPFFEAAEGHIAHALFCVPAVRAVEFGDGLAAASMRGSAHNDPFIDAQGRTSRNGAGGINGGITNGNEIVIRVAVKPASSIAKAQETFDFAAGHLGRLEIKGRHDTCIAVRAMVVLESAVAMALADLMLTARTAQQ